MSLVRIEPLGAGGVAIPAATGRCRVVAPAAALPTVAPAGRGTGWMKQALRYPSAAHPGEALVLVRNLENRLESKLAGKSEKA